ncbi:MAG: hypothetical protein ICV60_22745 [Pyrinomonadaceae bacterium]|nr:hypothetical protein [Pyrinomonadaceae bacterium]
MLFRLAGKEYHGSSALEIVNALKRDALDGETGSVTLREFLRWSYLELSERIPLRELDVSDRLDDEMLALSYLYLRDEFGAGELLEVPHRSRFARSL